MIKTHIGTKMKDNGKIIKIGLILDIEDPETIDQIIKKNNMILYTEQEYNDLKKENDRLSKRNHKLGNDIQKMESWLKKYYPSFYKRMKEDLK